MYFEPPLVSSADGITDRIPDERPSAPGGYSSGQAEKAEVRDDARQDEGHVPVNDGEQCDRRESVMNQK